MNVEGATSRRWRERGTRSRHRWLLLAALLLLPGLTPWLPRLLSVAAPPERADLLFVFPGEIPARARCAARLFAEGLAPRVLFSGGRVAPELEAIGQPLRDAAINALVATRAGIPETAVAVVPFGTSTWEDAGVLRTFLLAHPAREVLAVTSPIHSRRALLTLRLALQGLETRVRVTSCDRPYPPGSLWWTEERPLIQVFNETAKLALYAIRYLVPGALGLHSLPSAPPLPTPSASPGAI